MGRLKESVFIKPSVAELLEFASDPYWIIFSATGFYGRLKRREEWEARHVQELHEQGMDEASIAQELNLAPLQVRGWVKKIEREEVRRGASGPSRLGD